MTEYKICPSCQQPHTIRPTITTRDASRERFQFKHRTFCCWACQVQAQRRPATTRSGASHQAAKLKPKQPCERCGETRQSQIHHKDRNFMNNALDNLERLCNWCHKKEHAPETKARAAQGWITRRQRYGQGGHA